jgi:hypothetical protein
MSEFNRRESGVAVPRHPLQIIRREWAAKLHKYRFTSTVERPFVAMSAKLHLLMRTQDASHAKAYTVWAPVLP